jgi:histidinol-phosphate/aromatic aminotransferase/cobyric acid decarboxylase-like protein
MSMIRSPDLGPRVKQSIVENLHVLPRYVLIAIAMEVSRYPDRDFEQLKRELERVLIQPRTGWLNA